MSYSRAMRDAAIMPSMPALAESAGHDDAVELTECAPRQARLGTRSASSHSILVVAPMAKPAWRMIRRPTGRRRAW
jgi:hypothetical protein